MYMRGLLDERSVKSIPIRPRGIDFLPGKQAHDLIDMRQRILVNCAQTETQGAKAGLTSPFLSTVYEMSINEEDHTVTLQDGAVIQLYSEPQAFAKTTGWVTWNASISLIRFLERNGSCRDKVVADLSTGNGLVALAAARLGASSVMATEVPSCSPLTHVNVSCNPDVKDTIQVKDYSWGDDDCPIEGRDLVLASDLLFIAIRDSICDIFHATLVHICNANNTLLFCYEERLPDKEQGFIKGLEHDLCVVPIPEEQIEFPDDSNNDIFYEPPSIRMYYVTAKL